MLLILLSSTSSPALDPQKSIGQYIHNSWQTEQGLPQNSVHGIVQTRDGYIWVGTEEGLARFDGVRFVVFDKSNTPELKSSIINALLADHNGVLWIATRGGGMNRLENGKISGFTTADGLASDAVSSLCEARDGSIWIGTFGGGVSRFHNGKFTNYTTRDGLANNTVVAVAADMNGSVWIGTRGGGLCLFRNNSFQTYTMKDGLLNNVIYAILQDNSGAIWIGTGGGLNCLRDGKFSSYTTKDGLSMNIVYSLFEDRNSNLWVGTFGEGLNRFRDGKFSVFSKRDGLSGDLVWSMFEDREGNLWVGTSDGGLNRFKDGKFTTYTTSDGLSDNNVRSVFEDHEGNLWIATGRGIDLYRDAKWTAVRTSREMDNDLTWAVYEDRRENLWIAGDHTGLGRLSMGKKGLSGPEFFPLDFARAFYEDHEGNLWVGTRGNGLHRFSDGRFTSYTTANGLSNNTAWAILEDHEHALWIGTDGGGLNRFKDGRFTSFTTRNGLSHDSILSLHEDRAGSLWIGTWGGGLNRYKNGKFTSITSKDGLFDDVVWVILEDSHENLWMSSNKGVFRVSLNDLNSFSESKIKRIRSVVYGTSDGMRSRECNGASQPAGWKTQDGKLWFPTVEGATVINADHIEPSRYQPPVLIEEFIAGERTVSRMSVSKLEPGTEKFEFHYTALSFSSPEKVRFKYLLEGLDHDWVDAGLRRAAFYTHIPAGSYTFRVKACNEDGVWNENAATLSFILQPHFYETGWFYAGSALCILLLAWRLHKYRLTRALEFERIRMRIATDLHDDIGAGLSQIAILSEVLKQDSSNNSRSFASLTQIAQSSRELIDSMSDIVWSVNPEKDHVSDLSLRMRRFAMDLLESSKISVQFHTSQRDEQLLLDSFRRREIYLIFKESVNNVVRHSNCTEVHITLQRQGDSLLLQVEDNGKGYEYEAQSKSPGGHGLKSMKSRAQKMGGKLEIKTGASAGTSVTLTVPL